MRPHARDFGSEPLAGALIRQPDLPGGKPYDESMHGPERHSRTMPARLAHRQDQTARLLSPLPVHRLLSIARQASAVCSPPQPFGRAASSRPFSFFSEGQAAIVCIPAWSFGGSLASFGRGKPYRVWMIPRIHLGRVATSIRLTAAAGHPTLPVSSIIKRYTRIRRQELNASGNDV